MKNINIIKRSLLLSFFVGIKISLKKKAKILIGQHIFNVATNVDHK